MKSSVDVEPCAYDASKSHRYDEEHGILALWQMSDSGIESDGETCKSKSVIQHTLIFLLDTPVEHRTHYRPDNYRACIHNRS